MTEENVERASITLKGGKDYDAPWVVLKGGTLEDAAGELAKLNADDATLRAVATVAAAFHRVYLEAKNGVAAPAPTQASPSPEATYSTPAPQASQQQAQAPSAGQETLFCSKCGTRLEWKDFVSKANKAIKGYFCPEGKQRGDGHDAKFR